MTYDEFLEFIPAKCMYETIYDDSDGRPILVIRMLDAYGMVNKLTQPTWFVDSKLNPTERTWVGLTDQEIGQVFQEKCTEHGQLLNERAFRIAARWAEEKLKEKNT